MKYGVNFLKSAGRLNLHRTAIGLLTALACASAFAQTEPAPARWQFQFSPTTLPRYEPLMSTAPTRAAITGWAFSSPRAAVGLSFDVSTPTGTGLMPSLRGPALPSIDLGLRWRTELSRSSRLDLAAWRRSGAQPDPLGLASDPVYGTNVELQFDALNTFGFKPKQSAIGLQINSGGTALKSGQSVLYYRARF